LEEASPSQERWCALLQSIHASRTWYQGVLLLRWVQDGPEQLPEQVWPVLRKACFSLPRATLVEHSALLRRLLLQASGGDPQEVEALLGDAALFIAQSAGEDLEGYQGQLGRWAQAQLGRHVARALAWAREAPEGAPLELPLPWRIYTSNLLLWWRDAGHGLPEAAALERLLTQEREADNIRVYWVNPRPALRELFLTFPQAERRRMLMDGAGPVWLLPTAPDLEVVVHTLQNINVDTGTRYHLFELFNQEEGVDWRAPLLRLLALWPREAMKYTMTWLNGRDLSDQQEHFLWALENTPAPRRQWLHPWLCDKLTVEDFLRPRDLWAQAGPVAREVLARVLVCWARRPEHEGLLARLRAQAPEDPWWGRVQARACPDWEAMLARPPFWQEGAARGDDPEAALLASLWANPEYQEDSYHALDFYLETNFSGRALLDLLRWNAAQPSHQSTLGRLRGVHPRETFQAAALTVMRHQPIKPLRDLYLMSVGQAALPLEVHLKALEGGTSQMQSVASQEIAQAGAQALPSVLALLKARKGATRAAAARTLALMPTAEAVDALRAALDKERSAKIKPMLQAALEVCDPARRRLKEMGRAGQGFYELAAPLELRQGMEELRAVLYEPPTAVSWMRLCDLVQRLHQQGQAQPALDYLKGHNLERWPWEQRLTPWGWQDDPALASLGQPGQGEMRWWVPVSLLTTPAREDFLDEALPQIQKRAHRRKLPRDQVDLFLKWVETSWFWCQDNDIPIEELEVRLDGGAYQGMSRPDATALELRHGFAVSLARLPCYTGTIADAGLRWARVPLPRGHLLRSRHQLSPHQAHLWLNEVLDQP
jgi:hypothetical protein